MSILSAYGAQVLRADNSLSAFRVDKTLFDYFD